MKRVPRLLEKAMKLLALDTSSDACSVAVQVGEDVFEKHVVQAKIHTKILIPTIRQLMSDAGADMRDLDAIVLGNGPGSFIGMRIAASVAQGLAFGSRLKIVPVSSLAAVAAEVIHTHSATEVVVTQDARMNEVYLGTYRCDRDSLPVAVKAETLQPIEQIVGLNDIPSPERCAAGRGWQKYPLLLDRNRAAITKVVDVFYPKAEHLLGLGARGLRNGDAIEPQKLAPTYIRTKVAERPCELGS